ncbi:MAG: hypothetical protein ACREXT_04550 [Gammaproteobacteria bacterium]
MHDLPTRHRGAHIAVQLDAHLFVGDLLANKHHAWLERGAVDAWLETLAILQGLEPKYVYPGRGYAAGPTLLARQAEYLRRFDAEVKAAHPQEELADAQKKVLVKAIERLYPDYRNAFFINLGVSALWDKYARSSPTLP